MLSPLSLNFLRSKMYKNEPPFGTSLTLPIAPPRPRIYIFFHLSHASEHFLTSYKPEKKKKKKKSAVMLAVKQIMELFR